MPLHMPTNTQDQPPIQAVNMHTGSETVIILDWDDTLLCSSFLQENQFKLTSNLYDLQSPSPLDDLSDASKVQREIAIQLKELETCVVNLLRQATAFAHRTVIVTNAEHGWVQLSASKFLPGVVPYLGHVHIISARSSFEHLFPDSPLKWKYWAMQTYLVESECAFFGRDGRPHIMKHVLSFGDSHVEREAVRACTRGMTNTRTKSVKFAERPSMEQLRRQIELVTNCFQYIYSHDGDLDLQLTVTVNNNPAPAPQQQKASDGTESKSMYGNMLNSNKASDLLSTSEEKP